MKIYEVFPEKPTSAGAIARFGEAEQVARALKGHPGTRAGPRNARATMIVGHPYRS